MARGDVNQTLYQIYCKREKLLDMYYTTKELADTLGVTPKYVTDSMVKGYGVPTHKQSNGRFYISGLDVVEWIEKLYADKLIKKHDKKPLQDNEFICLKCHKRMEVNNSQLMTENNRVVKVAICPVCGSKMRKFIKS